MLQYMRHVVNVKFWQGKTSVLFQTS